MSEFEDRVNSILSDPAQMDKITKIAKSLMGGEAAEPEERSGGGENPLAAFLGSDGEEMAALGRISRALGAQTQQDKEKTALLEAMKPYLSEKRRRKMDKAMKIARLTRIARAAMGESGGDNDV